MDINYRDKSKPITAEDLIRRYNLDGLSKDRKAIQTNRNGLDKTDTLLNEFVESTTKNLQELQDQVDGNITTWFFNGVPTNENQPANEWTTDEDKINHLGDLYYDQDTGYAYRWATINNEYTWSKIVDADVVEALALANSAQDTADSKRRVFVTTPITPYEVGDIWIKDDKDLYRCRSERKEGDFVDVDWIRATDYSNDDYAKNVEAVLNDFKEEVQTDYATKVLLETTRDSINASVEANTTEIKTINKDIVSVNEHIDSVQANIKANEASITATNNNITNNYYQKSQVEQLVINSSTGLTNTFSEAGGNNVLRNTNFSAKEVLNEGQHYEYWDGDADRLSNNNSANGYSIELKRASIGIEEKEITGTNSISLKEVVEGNASSYNIKGKCEQETEPSPDYPSEIKTIPSIRNLFDKDNANILNGYVNATGNIYTENSSFRTLYLKINSNTTYTVSKIASARFNVSTYTDIPSNGDVATNLISNNAGTKLTITSGSSDKYLCVYYYSTTNDTLTEQEILDSIMIEEGSIAHDYIPYGAWAKVKVTNENLFDKNNANILNAYATVNTPVITSNNNFRILYIPCEVNTTYNIQKVSSTRFSVSYTTDIPTIGMSVNGIVQNNTATEEIYTTGDNAKYLVILYYNSASDTLTEQEILDSIYIYTEEKELLIDLSKPNLFDKSSIPTVTDGATVEEIDTGVKIISTKNGQVGSAYYARYLLFNIENLAGKEITISSNVVCSSINHGAFVFGTCDSEENNRTTLKYIDQLTSGYHKMSVTLPNTITNTNKYLYVILYSNRSDVDSVAGDYVEYNNLKIYEGYDSYYELASIGNTKDNLEVVSGTLTKKIGKVVLDGSESSWNKYIEGFGINVTSLNMKPKLIGYCDKYIVDNIYASFITKDYAIGYIYQNVSRLYLRNKDYTTLEEFKTWLSENPVTVYYELAEPETIQLTQTNIPLFEGYNEVSLVEDLDTETSIEYTGYAFNNSLKQEQIVANGSYTISFMYKILNKLAEVKVKINNKEYLLTKTDWTLFQTGIKDEDGNYITEPITISDNHLTLEFITNIDNACEIYDIMCNAGSVKLAYSQNQNETVTDTVNISKGITITSSTSDVKFTANNDGIRTKTLNDEAITEFTDRGMDTKQATIKDEAIIVGILRQRVGNQVWDSLI